MDDSGLFAQLQVILFSLDGEGRFCLLNPAAEAVFCRSARELLGQPFEVVLDPFSLEKAQMMLERTYAEGGLTDWELDVLSCGGAPVLVGFTTTLLRDAQGKPVGVGVVGRDMTSKLELTTELARTNQQLEGALLQLEKTHAALKQTQTQLVQSEKMRAMGQMVAGTAHEINNPTAFVANNLAHLASVLPRVEALYRAYLPLRPLADAQQLVQIAAAEDAADLTYLWNDLRDLVLESQQGVERIRNIVLSLRNFSRLDEGDLKLADVNEGLQNTVRLVRPLAGKQVEILEDYQTLPRIYCHAGELNQVFLNLLTNAMQAVQAKNGGRIWVQSTCSADALHISIRDEGVGMDARTLSRLGEPFFTTKPVGAGTGLGLAVSFGIIQRHRGKLHFESTPGEGTTACVELPIKND